MPTWQKSSRPPLFTKYSLRKHQRNDGYRVLLCSLIFPISSAALNSNEMSVNVAVIILFTLFHLVDIQAAPSFSGPNNISFDVFDQKTDASFLLFQGDSAIVSGALQITPDTISNPDLLINKAGRVLYSKPFKLWSSSDDNVHASFNSSFLINLHRPLNWTAGEGLAFLIAPDISIPAASFGQWLGLTNASTNGNRSNQIVAIEFDTEKQDYDPDDNHIGLNINSVISTKNVSLGPHNITLSPQGGANHSVWVQYNGSSKLMEVYMGKQGEPKPEKPLLSETINLKDYVNQQSYFGFAASTGNNTEIELHCVLKWSLEVDVLKEESDSISLKIGLGVGVPAGVILLVLFGVLYVKKRRRRGRSDEENNVFDKSLSWLPEMPKEFKYKDIKKATNNFHDSMRLGEGGYGIVYKGILNIKDDNTATEIAVKQFSRDRIKGKDDFLAELTIIYRLRHKHLVRLIGNLLFNVLYLFLSSSCYLFL
ncbi:hypothetical protein FH972_005404 [Carpinus fangiana]|uniref:Protein kinase domain-containing protein n=1 Tax=Carpinus fangiana TaxID=176857 RepID=A0A5N6QQ43_9ROSI|nr:hypothetical protein FH972_005404 [Carpinus fangiana]